METEKECESIFGIDLLRHCLRCGFFRSRRIHALTCSYLLKGFVILRVHGAKHSVPPVEVDAIVAVEKLMVHVVVRRRVVPKHETACKTFWKQLNARMPQHIIGDLKKRKCEQRIEVEWKTEN